VELGQHVNAAFRPRFVVATDSFKGTFTADEAARAIATGVVEQGAAAVARPVADGGEGTLAVIVAALDGERRTAACHDALGREIIAEFGLIEHGRTAVVEAAAAAGLPMIAEGDRDAEASTTAGVGELILAALAAGAERVIVTVGGVASTDGGRGAVDVLAAHHRIPMTVLCDVDTAFENAAVVFAPQKGADPAAVERLTARLHRYAKALPRDPRGVPRTGAAGGLAGGLWAARDAELVSGAEYVLRLLDFDALLHGADAVVTGEGCFDEQSLRGKIVGAVLEHARAAGVPVYVVAGRSEWTDPPTGIAGVVIASSPDELVAAGRRIAARFADATP